MQKTLRIHFTNGSHKDMDARNMEQGSKTIGLAANDIMWLRGMQQVAMNGVIDDGATENFVSYIPPSQIKRVELFFGEPPVHGWKRKVREFFKRWVGL